MRRIRLVVRGVVQGVGFRLSMQRVARTAGAAGWVRNRSDGSVEAEVEGGREAVDAVVAWARTGPRGSVVDDLQSSELAPRGDRGFEVLPDA